MFPVLKKYASCAYASLRIVSGLLFAMHGSQKLLGMPGNRPRLPIFSMLGIAGLIEMVGGLMIMFGLFAAVAAFVASGEMAVAYFKAHFPHDPLPIVNQGELSVLFCFIFLYIAAVGSGPWSLDRLLKTGGDVPGH
jgi:putative oxidoreductase